MNTDRKIHALINRRKSIRAFSPKKITHSVIKDCLEAARWTPSSGNNQPWRYIIIDKKSPNRAKLEATLSKGNGWAKQAPVLVVVCAREEDDPSYSDTDYFGYDTGMSIMSFVLEAQHQGLKCHQMGGFDHEAAKKVLSIPKEYSVWAITAVGYPGKVSSLDERTQAKEKQKRVRKLITEVAFRDKFGKTY
ncbi:MAG: nitroreductase family protein [bacterium]|nr:nitroreductase family protein [bacterium]